MRQIARHNLNSNTNNPVERARRMRKVPQKIAGGHRPDKGAQAFALLRSVLTSGRKQGRNRLEALQQGPEVLLAALPA